jgi:hypothetical protein
MLKAVPFGAAFAIPFCRKSMAVNRQCGENRKKWRCLARERIAKRNPEFAREGVNEE